MKFCFSTFILDQHLAATWLSRSSPSIGVLRSGRFNEVCGFYDPLREADELMVKWN